ncbi:hypothetical protein QE152_g35155 [Popillia japonica]|uniref:Uncharacterized protein n=1 Tax=Popillia japonica TaxID=7064 RepID=A0AAW1IQX8_POPJA
MCIQEARCQYTKIPPIVSSAMDAAVNRHNITFDFRATGIWPLNEFVFDDTDYLSSAVTDQPPPAADCNPQEDGSTAASGDQCATKEVVEAFRQPVEASTPTAPDKGDDFQDLSKALVSSRPLPKAAL